MVRSTTRRLTCTFGSDGRTDARFRTAAHRVTAQLRRPRNMTPCQASPLLFTSDDPTEIESAKDLCLDCPLMLACERTGYTDPHGVYGGLSAEDRDRINPEAMDEARRIRRAESIALDKSIKALTAPSHPLKDQIVALIDSGMPLRRVARELSVGMQTVINHANHRLVA